jgi:hypothetical protein
MEVKFGIHITNVAPGDFATNIASGRYHAQLWALLMRFLMETLRTMDEHVDGVVIQMKWLKLFKIIQTKEPRVHYKVGAFMQQFSIVLKRILLIKFTKKKNAHEPL